MRQLDRCVLFTIFTFISLYCFYFIWERSGTKEELIESIHNHVEKLAYSSREEMELRNQQIKSACQKYPHLRSYRHENERVRFREESLRYLVTDDNSTMLYCPVPKCGWSSWRTMLFEERAAEEDRVILEDLTKTGWVTPWHLAKLIPTTGQDGVSLVENGMLYRMVFVRDPYDRLVSAYKDKVMRNNGAYIRHWKEPCHWVTDDSPLLSFSQFVQCITDNALEYSHGNLTRYDAGSLLDMHWKPQSLICNVCTIDYNIIGHFDRMNEDMQEAISQLGMKVRTHWGNRSKTKRYLSQWYNQLSNDQIETIRRLYKYDFEIFGFPSRLPVD